MELKLGLENICPNVKIYHVFSNAVGVIERVCTVHYVSPISNMCGSIHRH